MFGFEGTALRTVFRKNGKNEIFRWFCRAEIFSSIAQSVEHSAVNRSVVGSSPTWGVKRGLTRYFSLEIWLHGQAVKTSPFHGGNTGSIPVGVIVVKVEYAD